MATTTQGPMAYMQPYLTDYMGRANEVANTPYTQSPTQFVGPNQTLQAGWDATTNRALNGSPVMNAANTALINTINGGGQNNPYLSQSIADAQGDLTSAWNNVQKPQWDKAMSSSGSFGNTGVSQYASMDANNLMKNVGRIGTDMRMAGYESERGRQMQALGMAPQYAANDYLDANALMQVGNAQQKFNEGSANQAYKWWEEAKNFPGQQLDEYGRRLSLNTGTTTTTPDPSKASTVIGGASVGAALLPWFMQGWGG
jgi:hypothetical protein